MNRAKSTKRIFWRSVCFAALVSLAASVASGQDSIAITQVDPSNFPEMAVYIDAEASKLAAGMTPKDFVVTEEGEPVEIVDFAGEGEPRPVDVVFVFDTTSSMGGEIDGVIRSSIAFAEQLRANGRDFRLGLVAFGDEIRGIANPDFTLTADAAEFTGWVSRLRAEGGGDTPEVALDGLEQATAMQFREDAQKVLLLITDAAPHEAGDGTSFSRLTAADVTAQLRDQGFVVYAVTLDAPAYQALASETGGKFYELTRRADFTTLIDEIGGDIARQYRLTYVSPRSSYDGTLRNIVVSVAGKTGEQRFLEPHLINIQSNVSIGMGLFFALLMALFLPAALEGGPRWARRSGEGSSPREAPVAAVPRAPTCPTCGRDVRVGARFCGGCGTRL